MLHQPLLYFPGILKIRDAITAGELQPGDRLPSGAELQARYGLAPMTVQSAIRELRGEGLLGRYTVPNVPEGTYQVSASAPGISATEPRQVGVTGKKSHAGTDFALPRPAATQQVSLTGTGQEVHADAASRFTSSSCRSAEWPRRVRFPSPR
ncbi:GntR family transcriptional regulator [Amycolatopsis sp. NPDC051373]|uniref:GntR family transcriptional regulator n=1 Tax=Amycolatopsis sp. NPDC051373 TaxID=3155801 RepID=UPI00344E0FD5